MRIFATTVSTVFVLFFLGATSVHATEVRARLDKKQAIALKRAMQLYGWSIPVCVWPVRQDVRPYCYSVSQLVQKYPFYATYIANSVYGIAERRVATWAVSKLAPEQVVEKLLEHGTFAGCVPKGKNRGAITLGQLADLGGSGASVGSARLALMKKNCEGSLSNTIPGIDLTFGVLAGSAQGTPFLSIYPGEQGSYQTYLDECNAQRAANPRSGVSEGGSTETEDEKKKREAAEKAKADAEKKKAEAAEAQKKADDAKKKAEDAQKKADDPNLPQADRDPAQADADRAFVDAQIAQDEADRLADDSQAAQDKADQAQKDLDIQKEIDEAKRDLGYALVGALIGSEVPPVGGGILALALTKYYGDYNRAVDKHRECMEGSDCALTCEQQARVRVARDQLLGARSQPKCNLDVTPLPDDDKCYDRPGGFFRPSQADLAGALVTACKQLEKVDFDCSKRFPGMFTKGAFDPCHGPLVMCGPEQSRQARGGAVGTGARSGQINSELKSVPIPSKFAIEGSAMWMNPRRVP